MGKIEQWGTIHLKGYSKDKRASNVEVNSNLFSENINIGSSNKRYLNICKVSSTSYFSNILFISIEDKGTELT